MTLQNETLQKTMSTSDDMESIQAVGNGAVEEIMLNRRPAVIVHGSWNHGTRQYDLSTVTAIQWNYDENTVYMLS